MKDLNLLFSWAVLLSMALAGCAGVTQNPVPPYAVPQPGQVEPVHVQAVITVLENIITGTQRGLILLNQERNIVFIGWPYLGGYGFICLDIRWKNTCDALYQIGGKGTYVNSADYGILVKAATEKLGYSKVTIEKLAQVAPGIVGSVSEAGKYLVSLVNGTLPNILVVPMSSFEGAPYVVETIQ